MAIVTDILKCCDDVALIIIPHHLLPTSTPVPSD